MHWGIPRPNFAVEVVVKADPNDGGVDMGINVTNRSSNVTILYVAFPCVAGFKTLGSSASSDYLAIPRRDGLLVPNFQQSLARIATMRYEYTGSLTMQFFLIGDNQVGGIYNAVLDSASNFKALEIQNSTYSRPGFKFFWELYASNIYAGNQFTTSYFVTVAGFSGASWEDGAALYKSWALGQSYVEKGPLLTRTDVPNWFKNVGLVWKVSPPDDLIPNTALNVNQVFENETALLDIWGWNRYGFDTGYGDYFPPIDGQSTLQNAIGQIHGEGDYATLFFSGVLADTNATTNPTFPSTQKYMIVTQNGQLYTEDEPNGAKVAVPDPTSQWWQSELVNFSVTAVKDYNVDGVYLDGLAIQSVILNYRNATNPTLSGSTFWQAYAQILTNLTNSIRQYNPNAVVTTEGENEVYIPYLDGFWDNMNQDNPATSGVPGGIEVPMFSFVYHEFALSYGTPYAYSAVPGKFGSSELFRYTLSKALVYGLVVRPDLPPYIQVLPKDSNFLMAATELEQSYSEYLRFGQMLPGPQISSANATYSFGAGYSLTVPAVSSGLFQANNGSDLLVVSNPTSSNQEIAIKFYYGEFGPRQVVQSANVCELDSGMSDCLATNSSGYVTIDIGNLSNSVFRIVPVLQTLTTSTTITTLTTSSSQTQNRQAAVSWDVVPIVIVLIVTGVAVSLTYHRRYKIQ
jgi:hypothetical protein